MRFSYPLHNTGLRLAGLSVVVIVFWGLSAWLRILAIEIPPLELTGIALAGAAASSLLLAKLRTAVQSVRQHPWYMWFIAVGSLIGSAVFFFVALAHAPAARVVVITYSWPLLFAITSDLYSHRRPAPLTFVALLLGLAGVAVMNGGAQSPAPDAWLGYAASLASGLCWVVYSLFVQVYPRSLTSVYPALFALGALTTLAIQAAIGGLVWPHTATAWAASIFLGVGPYGLGFLAWGYVVRRGNPRIVPVLPYAVPAVSAFILVLVGQTQPTLSLLTGCTLVIIACILSTQTRAAH